MSSTHCCASKTNGAAAACCGSSRAACCKMPTGAAAQKTELEGSRWYIENYRNAHELELCDIEQKQSAFVSKCVDSTLTVPHKINAIGLNGCSKTNLIVDDVISGIDVTNCDCIAIKINGSCKSVSIDRCHTVQIYLMTAASYDCQIFYCEARNVKVFLAKDGDEEPTELTVNDLWKTTYDAATGTLVTVPSEAAAVN